MRAHLVQLDIAWEDPAANRERIGELIGSAAIEPGDLIALPEMYASGFSLNVDVTADDDNEDAAFLASLAKKSGATVVGGITVRSETRALNRALVYGPSGERLARYDKIHPFSFGREHEVFTGGERIALFEWNGLKVMPAICYDLRFPELFRAGLDAGAEAFVVIANWPAARQAHWRALNVARAIENQAAVLAVNRTGADPHLDYAGGSIALDARGLPVAEADERERVLTAEIDPEDVRSWRESFPAWLDRRATLWSRPENA